MVDGLDLVVIGAGPGGSSAAAAALAGGLTVTQLEAERFPRVKPCAGGLTPKAVGALPVDLASSLRGSFQEFEFNAWRSRRTVFSFRSPVLSMVSRPELDQRLVLENLRRPSFTFYDGERVRAIEWRAPHFHVRTERRELRARQLVGADGANGVVNRLFRVSEPRARALAVEVVLRRADLRGEPPLRPVFDFGAVPRGYGWVFPKDDQVSAGLYTLARGQKGVRAALSAYLAAKGLAVRGDALASFEAHPIPLGGHRLRPSGLPLYLVGDAAGFADALTGEGIYHALASGRIAGELAARVARGAGEPREFAMLLARPVLADTRWSLRLAPLFYARPEWALRALCATPLWRALVHGTGSGATFSACLRQAPRFWGASRRARSAGLRVGAGSGG